MEARVAFHHTIEQPNVPIFEHDCRVRGSSHLRRVDMPISSIVLGSQGYNTLDTIRIVDLSIDGCRQ